jgi:peptide/nickel transport system substrate-binding protein/oligopeptide transport system substrate-binding protein
MVLEAPHVLDPAAVDSVYDALPVGQIFDGLVALDPGLNVTPALADTWTISRDGRTYTFHLRSGVRFHDGTPLVAADVVFSIRRLLDPSREKKSIAASYLQVVEGAPDYSAGRSRELSGLVAVDAQTVRIRLARPYLSFLEVLAMDDLRVVPEHVLAAAGEDGFRKSPIGTGPFRFASRTDASLRLIAYPDYFGGAPHLDEVVIYFPRANESDGGNARFLAGETEIVEPSSDSLPALLRDPSVELHRYQDLSLAFMGLNTGTKMLADERVRRAIAMAIDRKALAAVAPSNRREAQGILPPGLPGYSPTPKALPYDPDEARRLLAEAGHPNGRGLPPIPFYSAQSTTSATEKSNEILKRDLAAIGLTLDVRATSWSDLIAHIEDSDAPAFQLGWVADLPDPDAFLRTLFEPGGSANYFAFLDRDTAAALERGASETNPLERAKIYRELERAILDKAPLIPLFHSVGMIASRRTVHGFKPGPLGIGSLDLEHVWLTPHGSRG